MVDADDSERYVLAKDCGPAFETVAFDPEDVQLEPEEAADGPQSSSLLSAGRTGPSSTAAAVAAAPTLAVAGGLRDRSSRPPTQPPITASSTSGETADKAFPAPPPSPQSPSALDPLTLSLLATFSLLGCLARLGLSALFSYAGESIFPLVWAQAVGCLLMGLALGQKTALEGTSLGPSLYIGWTTGLCGSITTFSSWMVQTFAAFSNLDGQPRSGVHDAADGIAQIVITLAVSAFSLALGRRLALYLPSICLHGNPQIATTSSIRPTRIVVGILCCATYLSAILALGLSRRDWPGHRVLFALVLAPPGTILRWWLARVLNTQSTRFPTSGTLAANFLATAVLAVGYLLQRIVPLGQGLSPIGCQALQAVEDGFCGSLSTISTFVTELDALSSRSIDELERLRATGNGEPSARRRMGLVEREALWLYVGASVVLGQALVVLILGVGWWASPRGVGPVCRFAR